MKNKTMENKILTVEHYKIFRMLDGTNAAELTADFAEIQYSGYIDDVLRICRQYDHPGCNTGAHELARKIQTVLAIFDEVRAEEIDELAFRGGDENE